MSGRQSLLAVADQGLWALTNFSLVVSLAHLGSREEFGRLGIGLSAGILLAGLASCVGGEALAVSRGIFLRSHERQPQESHPVLAGYTARAVGFVMIIGLLAPLFVLGAVAAVGHEWASPALLLLAPACCFAVIAEGLRATLYATRRPELARMLAPGWLLLQGVGTAVAWLTGRLTVEAVVIVWGLGALASVIGAVVMHPVKPMYRGTTTGEWRRNRRFGFEFLATAGPAQALVPLAGLLTGLTSAGIVRALQSVYGPLNIVLQGVANVVIPAKAQESRRVWRTGALVAAMATSVAALATALLVTPGLGQALLGGSWPESPLVVVGYGIGRCAQAAIFGALVVYRAHDAYRLSSRLRFISALAMLIPFILAAPAGIVAALWASSGGFVCVALAWWVFPLRLAKAERSGQPAERPGSPAVPRRVSG